ncbi:uncharacterized protein BX663DRAFT_489123 [Cokeromyces recurvatus]|uniref:uncharacterized protein n=1 Tax=Cokeromyces recurvatus TaxID=90255 RepID=UPI002220CAD1|nr:uncharacterized protein BX663DRAFT_489123 [Cokeromyces recurvatus]KAI7899453.1 hypothetical protein BX663DRAFT_489123 [Cokeromyces recurvatus]
MMGGISSVITLKASVSGIQWRRELIPRPKDLDFYIKVFLKLTKQNRKPSKSTKTKDYRDLIQKYKNEYCILTKYDPIELKYAQQIAAYECAKIDTAYKNSVILQFGNRFRMFINHLTQQEAKITKRKRELKKAKKREDNIKQIFSDGITKPLTQLKLSFASCNTQSMPATHLDDKGRQTFNLDKGFIWSQIVNLSSKGMKDQGASKSLKSRGMIQSDGESTKGGMRGTRLKEDDNFRYIHQLSKTELEETTGRCVLIDPGRRDMLYCMQENIKEYENYLSRFPASAIKVDKSSDYLKACSIVEDPLRESSQMPQSTMFGVLFASGTEKGLTAQLGSRDSL